MEELDLEILPPTTNQGDENDANFANRLLPRLDPEKLRSQPLLSHETPFPDSGKASKERNELAKQMNDSLTITSGKKKEKGILRDYDVMLNLTDVGKNNNKFYHIQILKTSSGYVLNTEWGRVGYDARDKKQVFQSKIDAIGAFEKKFYEKTYNEWSDRENFQTKAGKYTLISVAGGGMSKDTINSEIQRLNKRNQELKTRIDTLQSNLDPRIFSLMRLIWDINRMNKTLKGIFLHISS